MLLAAARFLGPMQFRENRVLGRRNGELYSQDIFNILPPKTRYVERLIRQYPEIDLVAGVHISVVPVVTFAQTLPIDPHQLAFRHIGESPAESVEKQHSAELRELKGFF